MERRLYTEPIIALHLSREQYVRQRCVRLHADVVEIRARVQVRLHRYANRCFLYSDTNSDVRG